jgi:hypothetical protein
MKPKGNASVRELLGENKFSTKPFREFEDPQYQRFIDHLGGDEIKQKVPFELSKEEKVAFYQDVKDRVANGSSPDEIARDVLASVQEFLKEKEAEAYGEVNPKLKGVKGGFKRVE